MPRAILVSTGTRLSPWHHRLALVAFLALMLRAWIPAGFMPASDGSFALVACPGVSTVAQDSALPGLHAHHHHDGHQGRAHDMPCPFAVASIAAAPRDSVALAPPILVRSAELNAPSRALLLSEDLSHLRPPSTGPPTRL